MKRYFYTTILTSLLLSTPSLAGDPLEVRAEVNLRYGSERSTFMSEFWVPIAQDENGVFYGDLRMMGDDQENREGNLGFGYRQISKLPLTDTKAVIGAHGWIDRRITSRGSKFHQVTAGVEVLGDVIDFRLNGYVPLSNEREVEIANTNPQGAILSGTGILVDTNGTVLEEPQHGFDLELGWELGSQFDFIRDHTDSLRVYGGAYYFNGDHTESVSGWRTRFSTDVTQNIQLGARFQRDDVRGSQGFLEATIRFPFDHKQSYREEGLRARLDESPERDIDIVTGDVVTDTGSRVQLLNAETGDAQEVLVVDNTAAGGGDGSAETPFNTLADAEAAASAHTIIYVRRGDGTSSNQDQGITLDKVGQQLIGSGSNFVYDSGKFTTANGASPTSAVLIAASSAPTIGNVNALGDGVTVSADDITVAGLIVDNGNTGRDGIVVEADGAGASAQDVIIDNVTTQNARMGIYLHGTNSGSVSAKVQNSVTTSNSQHGIAVYDDTDGTFDVDLGGGSMGSVGNNVLTGNTLEDLAVDYDGRTLAAQNNWWGQASGPDEDTPDIGIAPQIYYGAPINDNLVGHWTFDTEWTTNTTAYDRSGNGNDGALSGGLSLSDQVSDGNRESLDFDGAGYVYVPEDDSLDIGTNSQSWFITFKTSATDRRILYRKSGASNADGIICDVYFTDVRCRVDYTNAVQIDTSGTGQNFADGVWHSLAAVYNNDTDRLQLYVDGNFIMDADISSQGPDLNPNAGALIGQGSGFHFIGGIDDVRVYDSALSSSDIQALHSLGTASSVDTSSFLTSSP